MAAKQPSINDWSNTNVRGENGIRYTFGEKVLREIL